MFKQPSLLDKLQERRWPPAERFPLNLEASKVEDVIRQDLLDSRRYVIITGYSSLEHLVSFFGTGDFSGREITVVLGHELDLTERDFSRPWPEVNLAQEIREYWLSRGVSISLCGALVRFLSHLREGKIRFRLGEGVHAKIYFGEKHAVVGSSNFSRAGLRFQKEANCRFAKDDPRYQELALIVKNFLKDSRDYQQEIIALLEELLRYTTWQEVLAYAVLQIMEEDWLQPYEGLNRVFSTLKLWPSQRQAVAQALWVLDNHGSVLIADPTGAGKTKVGIALLCALHYRFWARQEFQRATSYIICPPGVKDQWEEEVSFEGVPLFLETISQGLLSIAESAARGRALDKIRRANILLIDEAHNYLSRTSRRSQTIQLNSPAEHVILMTATPINRGVEDLLRLMEVLGLDNLSDEALAAYYQIRRELETGKRLSVAQFQKLKRYVQVFTVRRTKKELNRLIEQEPHAYRDRFGRPCRFPKEISRLYPTEETEKDRALAREIDHLARELKGLVWLRKTLSDLWQGKVSLDPKFLSARLSAAAALARFNVKAMLRSSRVALVEHIEGTVAAQKVFGLTGKFKNVTGDLLGSLTAWRRKAEAHFRPPPKELMAPAWLEDEEKFFEALATEQELYRKIAALAREISDRRERGKVLFVKKLFEKHRLILAYDSRLITLAYFQELMADLAPEIETLLVTGNRRGEREKIKRLFSLGSEEKNVLALCSDAVAEGVNLQQASAVVFFDLPSVIRLAEQRIGRIERLDSPYEEVEIYWPNDSPEFCVSTDRRLVERHFLVENILGSNISIPEEFLGYVDGWQEEHISGSLMLELYERERKRAETSFWDDLADAFQPVKDLVEGDDPLVPKEIFRQFKGLKLSGTTFVSVVRSSRPWCFLCLKGDRKRGTAPRWLFLEKGRPPITDIFEICRKLRENLSPVEDSSPWTEEAERLLQEFLGQLKEAELSLLPSRRRRALEVLRDVLRSYGRKTRKDERRKLILNRLLYCLDHYTQENVDLYHLSQLWLDLLRPRFLELMQSNKRKGPVLLKDLKRHLREHPLETESLRHLLEGMQTREPLEKGIAACLLGVVSR